MASRQPRSHLDTIKFDESRVNVPDSQVEVTKSLEGRLPSLITESWANAKASLHFLLGFGE
jgi:hypothetical protein